MRPLRALLLACVLMLAACPALAARLPEFDSLEDIQPWLIQRVEERMETVRLRIADPEIHEMDLSDVAAEICRMASLPYSTVTLYYNGDMELTLYYYPGMRIADAWLHGNADTLTETERETLAAAQKIVREALDEADSLLSFELAIHDALCRHISYSYGDLYYDIEDGGIPSHLTAIGALLEGSANCQGYADAFYLTATLAGFDVNYQNGYSFGERHVWNTIQLEDSWYIVDVCGDDTQGDDLNPDVANYCYFNAGRDIVSGALEWPPHYEIEAVSEESDQHYFYFAPQGAGKNRYGEAFTDMDLMAGYIIGQMQRYGQSTTYTMAADMTLSWDALSDALQRKTASMTHEVRWLINYWNISGHTYFITQWTQF